MKAHIYPRAKMVFLDISEEGGGLGELRGWSIEVRKPPGGFSGYEARVGGLWGLASRVGRGPPPEPPLGFVGPFGEDA